MDWRDTEKVEGEGDGRNSEEGQKRRGSVDEEKGREGMRREGRVEMETEGQKDKAALTPPLSLQSEIWIRI